MTTLFRSCLVACLCLPALAQAQAIPSGGFETWAARNGVDSPTGWLTTDDVIAAQFGVSFPSGTFSKATDAHSGSYDVRLETKSTLLGTIPGAVALGTVAGSNPALPGGIAFTTRPAMLQFYYKLSGTPATTASDGAFAQVALTRFVNGRSQTIASAKQLLTTPTGAYVLAQVPLTYASGLVPDSLRLVFSSGAIISVNSPTVGTVLQVDDVSFTGTVTATRDAALSAALQVFPNPSQDGRYLLSATPGLVAAPLSVVDVTGRVVHHEDGLAQGTATRTLDLSKLSQGIYTLQVFTEQGLVTKQLLVR